MNSSRQPKGIPVGGQFAPQVHAEVDITLEEPVDLVDGSFDDRTPEERWADIFTPQQRSVLTRNGLTATEWVDVAEVIREDGHTKDHLLAEASHCGLEPDEAKRLFEVCGPQGPISVTNVAGLDHERLAAIPTSMRPVSPNQVRRLTEMDPDKLERVGYAWPHVLATMKRPDDVVRLNNAIAAVDAGIDQGYADLTGSDDDWHRARLVKEAGLDLETARAWAPCYPTMIEKLTDGGWGPGDIPGLDEARSQGDEVPPEARRQLTWAQFGVSKAQMEKWQEHGFQQHHGASPYIKAGIGPSGAAEWEAKVRYGPGGRGIAADVSSFKRHGVTPDQAAAAGEAGLRLSYEAAEMIPSITPDEIREWASVLPGGGGGVSPRTIRSWRSEVGISDPKRAAAWIGTIRDGGFSGDRSLLTMSVMRYVNTHVEPDEVVGGPHPAVLATARGLGLAVGDVEKSAAKAKNPVEGCRTMFRRRKLDVPF